MQPITLIITAGTSPAVITEMIYVIHKEKLGVIKEIKVITTARGQEEAEKRLLRFNPAESDYGALFALSNELGVNPSDIPLGKSSFYVPLSSTGERLNDIRNREDDLAFANLTNKVVREACAQKDQLVIACQAGGRKTMGAHLLSAMQVYSRKQDKVFHILINEPFEACPDFYFPTKESKHVTHFNKTTQADSKDAVIDLIDIPFLRLRTYLEDSLTDIDFNREYEEVLGSIEAFLSEQSAQPLKRLVIDMKERCVYVNKQKEANKVVLPPKEFTLFAMQCYLRKSKTSDDQISFYNLIQDVELRLLWHCFYYMATSTEASEDNFFEIELLKTSPNNWSKIKSVIKKKIGADLVGINSELEKKIQLTDFWSDEATPGNKNAEIQRCGIVLDSTKIHFVNSDSKMSQLSKYLENRFFSNFNKRDSKTNSFFAVQKAEDIKVKLVRIQDELIKVLG